MKPIRQRGQAFLLIALAFVGLAAFIGLAVDGGILYSNIGHLRRAVDAASLAAAKQFRAGQTPDDMEASAKEFLDFNNLDSATANVFVCERSINPGGPFDSHNDFSLCKCQDPSLQATSPDTCPLTPRKLVRVEGTLPVQFAFLPIIGFDSVDIHADATSENAALDVVLVIDTSPSMAYDLCEDGIDNDGDGTVDDCTIKHNKVGSVSESDPTLCNGVADIVNDPNRCQPFSDVREAAKDLVKKMFFPYDRVSIVTFDFFGTNQLTLVNGDNETTVTNTLNSLQVGREAIPSTDCPAYATIKDPAGCPSTNTAGGIRAANAELATNGRQESVWIMILLSDGAANAARSDPPSPQWICPGTTGNPDWVEPFCRDFDPATRHSPGNAMYDADDRARDMADLAGCLPTDPAAACPASGGNGVVIFTIGLGKAVTNNSQCDIQKPGPPASGYYTAAQCDTAKDAGEQLLRYIASVGDDGDPGTNPCAGAGIGSDCGNYYYAPSGSGVGRVFDAIASRIFTRITQ